jgi:hypothetical protein
MSVLISIWCIEEDHPNFTTFIFSDIIDPNKINWIQGIIYTKYRSEILLGIREREEETGRRSLPVDATNTAKLHGTKLHNKKWALPRP